MVSFEHELVILLFLLYFPVMLLSTRYNMTFAFHLLNNDGMYLTCQNDIEGHECHQIVSDNTKFLLGMDIKKFKFVVLLMNDDNTQVNPVWKFPVWLSPEWPLEQDGTVELRDDGNMVIHSIRGSNYESFNNPDDTLLPNQTLSLGMRLNSGKFSAIVDFNRIHFIEESRTLLGIWQLEKSCNSSYTMVSYTGTELHISNDCQKFTVATTMEPHPKLPFLRLDSTTGAFVSYKYDSEKKQWTKDISTDANFPFWTTTLWRENQQCGSNHLTVCRSDGKCDCHDPDDRNCSSTRIVDYKVARTLDNGSSLLYSYEDHYKLFLKPKVYSTSLESCKNKCIWHKCSKCTGVLYDNISTNCFFFQDDHSLRDIEFSIRNYHFDDPHRLDPIELVLVIPVTFMILWTSAIFMLGIAGYRLKFNPAQEIESLLASTQGLPQRFPYTTLATATMGFSEKLGSGGYGSVYKGTLNDKRVVAVKKLDSPTGTQGAKQFVTEVAGIGGISHVNIVKLCGFCVESATTHCLLVYDYMSNGSLDKWLFESKENQAYLTWQQRVNIALGTAQGLFYLHEESSEPILHLDIKPQNILLDERFTAKLADFGMAKLLENRDITQVHTCMRGTPGYMAPEWLTHFTATKKSDVFSYGMVLLEIIGGRKNVDHSRIIADEGNEGEIKDEDDGGWYFPPWVMRQVREGNILGVVDAKVRATASENIQLVKKLVHLALWCIQSNPGTRPPMQTVVQVLQGHVELGPAPVSLALSDTTSSGSSMTDMWHSGSFKRM